MRTFTPWLAVLCLYFLCAFAGAADAAPPHSPHKHDHDGSTPVDRSLARQCLAQARLNSEAGGIRVGLLLRDRSREDILRLAALVREELGAKAASDATAAPPRGDLRAAWLLNFLGARTETLAFDLATDGQVVRRVGPDGRYLFRTFGPGQDEFGKSRGKGKEFVLHANASTDGVERGLPRCYVRVFLRKMPGGEEYYLAAWQGLTKNAGPPPTPNPDGRHVPGLMDQWPNQPGL